MMTTPAIKIPLFIVKIGGNIIDDPAKQDKFLQDFGAVGAAKILIHGGGKIATRTGELLGIESKYIDGRRITDDATIDLVTMVYGGLINKKIVAQLQHLGCNAIGLTGADANLIPATRRPLVYPPAEPGSNQVPDPIDFGWVGDVDRGKCGLQTLTAFLNLGLTPVFAPLTHDGNGHLLNTNADTIASVISVAMAGVFDVRLIYCFEKRGVLEHIEDDDSVIRQINKTNYGTLKAEGKLFAGILPKIDNAFDAINAGVKSVLIGHADDLIQNTTEDTFGTLIN